MASAPHPPSRRPPSPPPAGSAGVKASPNLGRRARGRRCGRGALHVCITSAAPSLHAHSTYPPQGRRPHPSHPAPIQTNMFKFAVGFLALVAVSTVQAGVEREFEAGAAVRGYGRGQAAGRRPPAAATGPGATLPGPYVRGGAPPRPLLATAQANRRLGAMMRGNSRAARADRLAGKCAWFESQGVAGCPAPTPPPPPPPHPTPPRPLTPRPWA